MTLGRLEMNQGRSAELMLVLTSSDEQPTLQHHNQRMLMNLMISKPLSLRKSQQDHAIRILVRAKNPRRVSLNTFGVQLPKLHVEAIICDVRPQTRLHLLQVHLANGLLVHCVEPRSGPALDNDPFDDCPIAGQTREPVPRRHVPLASDPEDAKTGLPEPLNLLGSGADTTISSDNDQGAGRDRKNPIKGQRSTSRSALT